jgi:RNA polymerase sigma-70 factor (ECF subfamily)
MDGPTIQNPLEKRRIAEDRSRSRAIAAQKGITDDIAAEIPRLRRYAHVLLRDSIAADDLVQDSLERAISRQNLFQPGTNLRAWLFTIMHNLHVNAVIKARRTPSAGTSDDIADSHRSSVAPAQGDGLMLRDLERALGKLPEEQRAVVLLVGVEGLTYAESAAVLDVPVGTVMSRLARGRTRLRTLMNGEVRTTTEKDI